MLTKTSMKLALALGFSMCLCGCDWATVASQVNGLRFDPASGISNPGATALTGMLNPGIPTGVPGVPTASSAGQIIPGAVPTGATLPINPGGFGAGIVPAFSPSGQVVRFTSGGSGATGTTFEFSSSGFVARGFTTFSTLGTPFRGSNAQSFLQPTAPSAVGLPF